MVVSGVVVGAVGIGSMMMIGDSGGGRWSGWSWWMEWATVD
ncbi:hypothetical protein ACLEB1_04210 [Escherichia coli]